MTEAALAQRLDGRKHRRTGVIVRQRLGVNHPGTVMVLRDGMKQPERWARAAAEPFQVPREFDRSVESKTKNEHRGRVVINGRVEGTRIVVGIIMGIVVRPVIAVAITAPTRITVSVAPIIPAVVVVVMVSAASLGRCSQQRQG